LIGYHLGVSTETESNPVERVAEWAHEQHLQYAHGEDRPLAGYVTTASTYVAAIGVAALSVRVSRHELPERFLLRDLAVLAVGCHKAARLLAKDPVTSPLRAPVTRFVGPGGPSELREEVRGEGVRHALGELLTCPFCVAQWLATAGMFGLVVAPRPTRFVASTFAVVAVSDFLQLAYAAAQQRPSSARRVTRR
jgi:hypothetical protein